MDNKLASCVHLVWFRTFLLLAMHPLAGSQFEINSWCTYAFLLLKNFSVEASIILTFFLYYVTCTWTISHRPMKWLRLYECLLAPATWYLNGKDHHWWNWFGFINMFFTRLRTISVSYFVLHVEISCTKNMLLSYSYIFCTNTCAQMLYMYLHIYIDKNKVLLQQLTEFTNNF